MSGGLLTGVETGIAAGPPWRGTGRPAEARSPPASICVRPRRPHRRGDAVDRAAGARRQASRADPPARRPAGRRRPRPVGRTGRLVASAAAGRSRFPAVGSSSRVAGSVRQTGSVGGSAADVPARPGGSRRWPARPRPRLGGRRRQSERRPSRRSSVGGRSVPGGPVGLPDRSGPRRTSTVRRAPETGAPETARRRRSGAGRRHRPRRIGAGWLGRPERSAPTSPKSPIRISAPARNQPTGGSASPSSWASSHQADSARNTSPKANDTRSVR